MAGQWTFLKVFCGLHKLSTLVLVPVPVFFMAETDKVVYLFTGTATGTELNFKAENYFNL
jgi:hypothetical protein